MRGRFGFLAGPTILIYGTAGFAYGDAHLGVAISEALSTIPNPAVGGASVSDTKFGYAIGGGFEAALDRHWTFKGEYLYYDLGSLSTSFGVNQVTAIGNLPFVGVGVNSRTNFDGHIARVGLNYKF